MKLKILGSSSAGNCYLLESDKTCLVIEAGVKFKEVKEALKFNISKIAGGIISHSHGDHCKYLNEFLKSGINFYCDERTNREIKYNKKKYCLLFEQKKLFNIGEFKILPFPVKHDVFNTAFLINHFECGTILFATDTDDILYDFDGLNHIIIEANFSEEIMVENIMNGLPGIVARRSYSSHLSIDLSFAFLKRQNLNQCRTITLIHLSSGNSDAILFRDKIQNEFGIKTYIADKGMSINFDKF